MSEKSRPRRHPLAAQEAAGPSGEGAHTLETIEGAHRYNAWIFQRINRHLGQRVLEVGCGTGTITQFLVDRKLVVGVDVVDDYVEAARRRFANHPNVVILHHDITGPGAFPPVGPDASPRFDSAVSVNVLEHIPDDTAALRAVYRLLDPGGTLTLLVPCHPALTSRFDHLIGHQRRYTKRDLRARLEQAGFQVEQLRRSNPVGAIGWLVNNRLLRRRKLSGLGLYDALVPLLARIDRLAEPPFGLSLVAVARKPHGAQPDNPLIR